MDFIFTDILNTFDLRLFCVSHMEKGHFMG